MINEIGQTRGGGYGLDAELAQRAIDRYDIDMEIEAREWIENITDMEIGDDFGQGLKNGVILCTLANKIHPNIIKRIESKSKIPFRLMENVSNFLKACRVIGVSEVDLFETVDLFELKDLGLVLKCVHALGRAVQKNYPDFQGPVLGVKESIRNERHFSSNQLSKARHAPTLVTLGGTLLNERPNVNRCNVNNAADAAIRYNRAPPLPPPPSSEKVKQIFQELEECNANSSEKDETHTLYISTDSNDDFGNLDPMAQAQKYIEHFIQRPFTSEFGPFLKDGTILCEFINCIRPNSVSKVQKSANPFKQMENITSFIQVCRAIGVAEYDLFETIDLYELKNVSLVVNCIHALGRVLQKILPELDGPTLGVREATANPRTFTKSQLKEATAAVTRLSMGSYGIMERPKIDCSASITFGHDAAEFFLKVRKSSTSTEEVTQIEERNDGNECIKE